MSDVIVVTDTRYGGVYEGCSSVAYLTDHLNQDLPLDSMGDDTDCCSWWCDDSNLDTVGVGDSDSAAVQDLRDKVGTNCQIVQWVSDIRDDDIWFHIDAQRIMESPAVFYYPPSIADVNQIVDAILERINSKGWVDGIPRGAVIQKNWNITIFNLSVFDLDAHATEDEVNKLNGLGCVIDNNFNLNVTVYTAD